MDKIFFVNSETFFRVLISAPIMYVFVIAYIRVLGKRSTSQLNSFDWIVTVAMGSLIAATIVQKKVSIADGLASILMLLLFQFILTKIVVRLPSFKSIISSSPKLLFFQGEFISENMKSERIAKSEILAAIRQQGISNTEAVYAVVLETNAKFSVIEKCENNSPLILKGVQGLPKNIEEKIEENS